MSVGILTIGNELLTGFIDDTNASWLGQELSAIGLKPRWHLTLGDDQESISKGLDLIPASTENVIVTGGLGPTHDDLTLKTICDHFSIELVFDQQYWEALEARFSAYGRKIPEINRNQALKPAGQELIPNPVGSARGAIINGKGQRFFILPGVPGEMKAMYTETIQPLLKHAGAESYVEILRATGIMESTMAEKLDGIHQKYPAVTLAFLPRLISLDLRLISNDKEQLASLKKEIETIAGKYIFGYGETGLEEVVGKMLLDRNLTLSTAESCTGGLVSHRLTQVDGSSGFFKGGIVSYSNEVKVEKLGVKEETLARFGAVSENTAHEMAAGVRESLGTDIGIAVTGIAGPTGGTEEKPVGLVYIAFASEDKVKTWKFNFHYDRERNKLLSSQVALNMIRIELKNA